MYTCTHRFLCEYDALDTKCPINTIIMAIIHKNNNKEVKALNCIGRKELSHVYIKHHAMTRAMTFGKGLPESEVVY